jgi:thioredoxin 2
MSVITVACPACRTDNQTPVAEIQQRPRCQRCRQALVYNSAFELTRETFDGVVRGSPLPLLLVLYSQWQPQSAMAWPVLQQVAQKHTGRVLVVKLNADICPDLAKRYAATTLPTLVLLRGGTEKGRLVGAPSISEAERLITGGRD